MQRLQGKYNVSAHPAKSSYLLPYYNFLHIQPSTVDNLYKGNEELCAMH